ncbi:MAG: transcriptional repressor [Bdellovibrionales bacterium]|nr:transcriptional repressor [Bdellovibrionales bacterium]
MASCSAANPRDYVEDSLQTLRESGARVTATRTAVLECLGSAKRPLSARDILERIQASPEMPKIDQASVYRIIETLLELGLVHKVFPSGHFMACRHSSCGEKLHLLAHCTKCDASLELGVPEQLTAPMSWYLTQQLGFLPTDHLFQVTGLCPTCKSSE